MFKNKYYGMMIGLALGDSLGAPIEFIPIADRPVMNSLTDAELCDATPGTWTDDTSMTLCLLESLVERNGFNATDQMTRYLKWYEDGYLTPTGTCDDIGKTVKIVLLSFKKYGTTKARRDETRQGNGSLVRSAAVALFHPKIDPLSERLAADSSFVTHGSSLAAECCQYLTKLLILALGNTSKEEILSVRPDQPCHPELNRMLSCYRELSLTDLTGTGQVLDTLALALRAFADTSNFEDGARMAVNHAKDSDSVGATYGQLAGAFYGLSAIDMSWISLLRETNVIMQVIDRAWEHQYRIDEIIDEELKSESQVPLETH